MVHPRGLPTDTLIDHRYLLHIPLGCGAMGTVYRATDRLHDTTVALKCITASPQDLAFASRTEGSGGELLRLALANEFRILASLRHPHIISVLDYGFDEQRRPFFTMDYLENAQDVLEAGQGQSTEHKIDLLLQMLEALVYLHRRDILHRDIKPANVLIVDGRVRVLDFGLSAPREAAQGRSGTFAYMSPEVLRAGQATQASDLYAIGVIAYELLSGRQPFPPGDIRGIITRPVDVTPLAGEPALARVVARLLRKAPAERYESASATIAAFYEALGRPPEPEDARIRESFLQAARFVGRDQDLQQLMEALDRAMAGQGSACLVGGESGVGKSRLLDELRPHALVKGALVLRGQAVESGGRPYRLWRDAVRRLALSSDLNDLEAGVLEEIVPDIATLLDREIPDAPELDPQLQHQRLILTIADLFRKTAHRQPVVLLLEDLQWTSAAGGGGEDLEILRQLSQVCATLPLLIVGDYRDDERPGLPQELPQMQVISMERLDAEQIATLSVSMLGQAGRQPQLVELLQRETEGNTFFLVETVRALVEEAGRMRDVGRGALPETVFAGGVRRLLQRRLRRMPEAAHPLLQRAAVAGRALDLNLLRALDPTVDLEAWLVAGADVAVLAVREEHWRFAHDKLRAAVLGELCPTELVDLHREVAAALEDLYAGELALYYGALAHHYGQAGDLEQERHYAHLAGEEAAARFANEDAVRFLSRALELTVETDAAGRYELLLAREKVHDLQGARDAQSGDLAALEELAAVLADNVPSPDIANKLWAEIALRQARFAELTGEYSAAAVAAQQAIHSLQTTPDAQVEAKSHLQWGRALWLQGEYEAARTQFGHALVLAQAARLRSVEMDSLRILGIISADQGCYSEAQGYFDQALQISREIGDRPGESAALNALGIVSEDQGDHAAALDYYEQAVHRCRELGDRRGEALSLLNLGNVCRVWGDYGTAEDYMEEAWTISREIGERLAESYALNNLGLVSMSRGDYIRAKSYFERVLHIARELGNRRDEGIVLSNLGLLYHQLDQDNAAHGYAQQALQIARELGDRPTEGEALTHMGHALAGLGRLADAADAYGRAVTLRRELGEGNRVVESLAGLARVALARKELSLAQDRVEEILSYLETDDTLGGTEEPLRIYTTCYRILQANGDPRAQDVLCTARRLLQERASRIGDDEARRSFMEGIAAHREIIQL